MIMDRQIHKPLVTAVSNPVANVLGPEHSVAAFAGDIVSSVDGQKQITRQQTVSAFRLCQPSSNDRAVFVPVFEKMRLELQIHVFRYRKTPAFVHGLLLSHSSTLRTFNMAVSTAGLSLFDRRDSWMALRPSKVACDIASPRTAFPSTLVRSARTNTG